MFRLFALALVLWVGGCTVVHQELDNRGGYVDYLADKYWWKADSKKMRALRAYALHAAIARIAMISPKGAAERNQLAYQVGSAGLYAQQLVKCAYDTVGEPCFYFDSIMVDYVNALYTAAVSALPLEDAQKLISNITGGVVGTAGAVDILHALIQLGADAVRYGTVSAALYRDSLELEVQVWINSPKEPGSMVGPLDVAALADIYATGRDDIPAWKAQIEALLAKGLEPTPNRRYLARLFQLISYACMQITTDETFRTKCIVNPGVTAAELADAGPTPTGRGTKKKTSGGNGDKPKPSPSPSPSPSSSPTPKPAPAPTPAPTSTPTQSQTDLDQLQKQRTDLARDIANNEQALQRMRALPAAQQAPLQQRMADLDNKIKEQKAKVEDLKKQIDDLTKNQ